MGRPFSANRADPAGPIGRPNRANRAAPIGPSLLGLLGAHAWDFLAFLLHFIDNMMIFLRRFGRLLLGHGEIIGRLLLGHGNTVGRLLIGPSISKRHYYNQDHSIQL